jgi:hypothetical protein
MCQVEREAAHWRPVGLAVAWSGSRVAGRQRLPLAWSVSGGARWRSAGKWCQVEDEAAHWRPIGLAVVCWSGPRVAVSKASVGQCSVAIGRQVVPGRRRGSALAADRACRGLLVRPSGCGQQGERRAVLGGDPRQAVPGRRRDNALAADRACCGLVRISGCGQQGERRAVLGGDRPASGARPKTRQRTGGRSGLLWPGQGVGLLAVVLSHRQFIRVFVLSIGEACREATTAPVSGGAR